MGNCCSVEEYWCDEWYPHYEQRFEPRSRRQRSEPRVFSAHTDESYMLLRRVFDAATQRKQLTGQSHLTFAEMRWLPEAKWYFVGLERFAHTKYAPAQYRNVSWAAQEFLNFTHDYYEGAKAHKLPFNDMAVGTHELWLTEHLNTNPAELWASNPGTETRNHSARARAAVAKAAKAAAAAQAAATAKAEAEAKAAATAEAQAEVKAAARAAARVKCDAEAKAAARAAAARAKAEAEAKAAAEAEEWAAMAEAKAAAAAAAAAAEEAAQAAAVAKMGQAVRGWSMAGSSGSGASSKGGSNRQLLEEWRLFAEPPDICVGSELWWAAMSNSTASSMRSV
jgi:hypothetical protein